MNTRHVAQGHGRGPNQSQRNLTEVGYLVQIAAGAHHEFGFGEFKHGTARFLVGRAYRLDHLFMRDAITGKFHRVEHHLILLDHAAQRGNFGNVLQGFQLEFEKPILNRAQLCQIVLAGAVDQGVLINPAHPGGVGAQCRLGRCRQPGLHLAEVFQHPRARPVEICPIFKDDIDKAVTEE